MLMLAGGGVVGEVLCHGISAVSDKAQPPPPPPFSLSDPFGGSDGCTGGENVRTRGVDRPTT